jgi:glycosyltransferase involved in cell wall biosynthesis
MNKNKLTICLLVYNHAHLIEKVIQSILDQTITDFELIISDDNSTDDSFNICTKLALTDNRIQVFKTPKNLGMAGNTNFVFSKTSSEWVALLHHDDILSKDCLECWLKIANGDDNIGFVFNDYEEPKKHRKHMRLKESLQPVMDGNYFLKKYLLRYLFSLVRGTALIRKKYFEEIGGMNEKFGIIADVDLWMRLSSRWNVGYVNKPLIKVIHQRPSSYPIEYTDFSWKTLFILFDIHSKNLNRNNFPIFIIYILKRFKFKNRVSLEIMKWYFYAILKKKYFIVSNFISDQNEYELFYSRIFRIIINLYINRLNR